jgi:hypothetical protein
VIAVLKIIAGSFVRHWASAFLAVLCVRVGLSHEQTASIVERLGHELSDDLVANALASVFAAIGPAAWSICSRLYQKLKLRLALILPAQTSERAVKEIIAEQPRAVQLAAIATADPEKLALPVVL